MSEQQTENLNAAIELIKQTIEQLEGVNQQDPLILKLREIRRSLSLRRYKNSMLQEVGDLFKEVSCFFQSVETICKKYRS